MECYFDNSATTRPTQGVIDAMVSVLADDFGNPSSLHRVGDGRSILGGVIVGLGTWRAGDRARTALLRHVVARAPELGVQAAADADEQEKGEEETAHGQAGIIGSGIRGRIPLVVGCRNGW